MKKLKPLAFLTAAALLTIGSPLYGAPSLTLPYLEDFSSGSEGYNADPLSPILHFNGFTYSVDGQGGVALFNAPAYLNTPLENFSNFAVLGDWQWSGSDMFDVHNFTVESSDATPFALSSLDWATGNEGPPTLYTLTGYRGETLVTQAVSIDITTAGLYGGGTTSAILATNIAPGDDSGYGLNLVFTGSDWGNIDRFVFSADGNDILVALDNIQYSPAIPEPSTTALLIGAGMLALGAGWRSRRSN